MTSTWLIIYEVVYSCINVSLVHKRVHTVRTRRYQDGCSLAKICLSSIIIMFQEDRITVEPKLREGRVHLASQSQDVLDCNFLCHISSICKRDGCSVIDIYVVGSSTNSTTSVRPYYNDQTDQTARSMRLPDRDT